MKIFISEADRESAQRIALKNIARFFNISDWESKSNTELSNDIHSLKGNSAAAIIELLDEYFDAYNTWFSFYQKRKKEEGKQGKEYVLTKPENLQLSKLIENREKALNALQKKFDELRAPKYSNRHLGKHVIGPTKGK